MKKVERHISLDLQRKNNTRVVFASQSDLNSRVLIISLFDDGESYPVFPGTGVTAAINVLRPDGKNNSFSAELLASGEIRYQITSWPLGMAGDAQFCVALYDESGARLTSAPFTVYVAAGLFLGSNIEEDNENQTAFANMMASLANIKSNDEIREANESIRKSNETSRKTAENTRNSQEGGRVNAEKVRVSNEDARKSNETQRVKNEEARIANESVRCQITDAFLAGLDNLLLIQEAYINSTGGAV